MFLELSHLNMFVVSFWMVFDWEVFFSGYFFLDILSVLAVGPSRLHCLAGLFFLLVLLSCTAFIVCIDYYIFYYTYCKPSWQ